MFDSDILCRAITFPRDFPASVLDFEVVARFDGIDEFTYALSLASRFLLKTEAMAHAYGCRTASKKNERIEEKSGSAPAPLKDKSHYLGFYDLLYRDIKNISLIHYRVSIYWRPENNEDAHFQVELSQRSSTAGKGSLRRDRADARRLLSAALFGPVRHVCDCDLEVVDELRAIDLPSRLSSAVSTEVAELNSPDL